MPKRYLYIACLLFLYCWAVPVACTQDWANLNRFQMENKALETVGNNNRIVFMGNSITEGWPNHSPAFFQNTAYINRGISGQTTPQMLLRFRQDVIDLEPAVVVVLAGINDIAGNTGPSTVEMIMDNIISMAELAQANDIEVILCAVLPAASFPWRPEIAPVEQVLDLNEKIKTYCEANSFLFVDYFSAMVDKENGLQAALTYDGVHPNQAGYEVMAPLVQQAIKMALEAE